MGKKWIKPPFDFPRAEYSDFNAVAAGKQVDEMRRRAKESASAIRYGLKTRARIQRMKWGARLWVEA